MTRATRAAAFALSSLIVLLAVYDKVREKSLLDKSPAPESAERPFLTPAPRVARHYEGLGTVSGLKTAERGAPVGEAVAAAQPTNESLAGVLEKEKDKMGIRHVIPPGAEAPGAESDDKPMTRAEARAYMRQMASALQKERRMMTQAKEPVPLDSGAKPALLSDSRTRPGAAAGGPAAPASDASGGAAMKSTSLDASTLHGPGAVVRDGDGLVALWRRLALSDPLPAVDFSKEMVVGLFRFSGRNGDNGFEIVAVKKSGGRLHVLYKESSSGPEENPRSAYALRIVPRSALPVVFEKAE